MPLPRCALAISSTVGAPTAAACAATATAADEQQHVDDEHDAQAGRADEPGEHRAEGEADERRRRHDAESGDVRVGGQQRAGHAVGRRHRDADPEAGDDQRGRSVVSDGSRTIERQRDAVDRRDGRHDARAATSAA